MYVGACNIHGFGTFYMHLPCNIHGFGTFYMHIACNIHVKLSLHGVLNFYLY